MKKRFDAAPVLAKLKPFQRNTVEHVIGRFHGSDHARRFLVADETGLGKSVVARGVIARTIELLQDDPDVQRIDIIYICSNADLARQNLRRLDVLDRGSHHMSSRLTMLATQTGYLNDGDENLIKPVKLISFTPGTSFDKGWSTGKWEERALLYRLLEVELDLRRARRTAAMRLLKQGVATWQRFDKQVEDFRRGVGASIDTDIQRRFLREARRPSSDGSSPLDRFGELVTQYAGRSVPTEAVEQARMLIGELRGVLAQSSIETLEPDLVILDEFQRFRDMLDRDSDAGQLAHEMFNYPAARVLLLSATPFKAYTLAEKEQAATAITRTSCAR